MTAHDLAGLGAYTLGVLDPDEVRAVDAHLAGCESCRAEIVELSAARDALDEVPPEFFLDGPPDDGELLLRRTLRAARAERATSTRPRRLLVAAAAVVVLAVGAVAGGVIGRSTAPAAPSASTAGQQTLTGADPTSGASMTVAVRPAAGWVRVHADVRGVAAGTRCQLVVTGRDGAMVVAGSWVVSPTGERDGTMIDGSALVAPADLATVEVWTLSGQLIVRAPA